MFALVHSLTAADFCKRRASAAGVAAHHYRLFYSLLALLLSVSWFALAHALPDAPLFTLRGAPEWIARALQITGLVILLQSFRAFDAGIFLGFRPMPEDGEPFSAQGIYRHLRHPMYSGVMLLLLASPRQSVNSLNLALVVSLYFIIGARFEEKRMLAMHPSYADYCRRTPRFIPWRAIGALFAHDRRSQ